MLNDFYKNNGIPEGEWMPLEKDIVIVAPSKEYDVKPVLDRLGLSKYEVAVTWLKEGVDIFSEIEAMAPKLVLQADEMTCEGYDVVRSDEDASQDVLDKVGAATADAFVSLHHHDEFSIKDGLGTIDQMLKLLKAQRRSFCAVTNHGSVGGWIKQYNACKKAGIKAIFGCLLPDQPIITLKGVKKIQDVIVGDEVLTHKGRFKRVLMTSKREYSGKIYSPEFWGNGDCWVTEEHPFLCYVGGVMEDGIGKTKAPGRDWKYHFDWIKASEINPKHLSGSRAHSVGRKEHGAVVKGAWTHYAVVPRIMTKMKPEIDVLDFIGDTYSADSQGRIYKDAQTYWYESNKYYAVNERISLDTDWMRLFGLYIAEGSSQNGLIRWTFNLETDSAAIDFVRNICKERLGLDLVFAGYVKREEGMVSKAADFYVCDMALYRLFTAMFGRGARHKKFPVKWLTLPDNLLESLLGGIWEGDGNKKTRCLRTASWELAQLCRLAVVKVTGHAYMVSDVLNDGRLAYDLKWADPNAKHYRTDRDKYRSFLPIKSMKSRVYNGPVYNLEVEDDNSYVSGVSVHNCEMYVSNYRGDDAEQKKLYRSANHLVLLARTKEGFDNIIRIHNDAHMNGFYYTPRANHEAFKKWGKGIISSSSCMAGELPRLLMAGEKDKAKELWEFYSSVFDRFYVELQIIECEDQRETNRRLIEFAREVGAPLLLTNDGHYLEPEHSETHDLLMCMRQGKTILDKIEDKEDVWNFDVKNLYYRNADQMWETFASGYVDETGVERMPFLDDVFTQEVFVEAQANTRELAKEVEETVLDSSIKLPKLYPNGKEVLRVKANDGLKKRWAKKVEREDKEAKDKGLSVKTPSERGEEWKLYIERINREFKVITKLGWTDYILIMEKIISETVKTHGEWAVGYGRGSSAGSLICYVLGITDVDPIVHGLLFERFIDESRGGVQACSFDL